MANKKKISVVSMIIAAVLAVALVLTIVGICIAWVKTTTTVTVLGNTSESSESYTLSKLLSDNKELKDNGFDGYEGLGVNTAFAIMTVVFCGLALIAYIVSKFVDFKWFKWVVLALAALTVICALVAFITSFTLANNLANVEGSGSSYASGDVKTSVVAGPWLLFIFGLIGGGAGVYGSLKG